MLPNNDSLFLNLDASINQESEAQWSLKIVRASFQLIAAGASPGGTIQIQASDDKAFGLPANQFQPTNWNDVGSPITVAAIGSFLVPTLECSYEYLRLIWAAGGGSVGTITARMKSMGL